MTRLQQKFARAGLRLVKRPDRTFDIIEKTSGGHIRRSINQTSYLAPRGDVIPSD
jgi:hypothetical protein